MDAPPWGRRSRGSRARFGRRDGGRSPVTVLQVLPTDQPDVIHALPIISISGVVQGLGVVGRLDVAVQKNVLNDFTEFVIDDDGTFHPLAGSSVDGPTPEASE